MSESMASQFPLWTSTFVASLRSIGTVFTMALTGYYLDRTSKIGAEGKRTLAVLSQQVTVPLFLFTKLIYCNNKADLNDNQQCPDIAKLLPDVWMLLFWPIYVVGVGLLVGAIVASTTQTPKRHVRSVLAACAFGNSTGLPITLLHVIHTNFPLASALGRIDPTLFLSVFLIPYPILLWGLGGYLLAPDGTSAVLTSTLETTLYHSPTTYNVSSDGINCQATVELSNTHHRNYYNQSPNVTAPTTSQGRSNADENFGRSELPLSQIDVQGQLEYHENDEEIESTMSLLGNANGDNPSSFSDQRVLTECTAVENTNTEASKASMYIWWHTVQRTANRCFQPPVLGAIAGIICASIPWLRGLLVDNVDVNNRDGGVAPFAFLFDGLYAIGMTAVPLNMMLMGCNLSSSSSSSNTSTLLSMRTMVGIVIGKMIVLPFIGIVSALLLKNYIWDIPGDIESAFYLVLMIVFLTPTANNVIVMVELTGSGAKEGMARVIALQY